MRPYFFTMKQKSGQIALCGMVAALYAVLTVVTASISYGPVQFRIAEALCVLCYFSPTCAWGLTLGCAIANCFSTVSALDLIFGSAATLIGCLAASRVKRKWLFPLPIILSNGILVGVELALTLTPGAFFAGMALYGGQVALGEAAVLYLIGLPAMVWIEKAGKG